MRIFSATVFTSDGEEQVLRLKALSEDTVRQYLHQQGYTIKHIAEQFRRGFWKTLQGIDIGQRIKPQHQIRFLKTLGKMIQRGYSLEKVIDFLLADEYQKDVVRLLRILQQKAQKGYKDYVELFQVASDCFDKEFFSILVAGQKTGTVGQNLIDYAEGKDKMLQQKGSLMKILSGKVLVLSVVLLAFGVIVTFVVPQFTKLFGEKLELPIGMQVMVWLSEVLQQHGVLVLLSLVFTSILLGGMYRFHERFRFLAQHLLLKLPVFGQLLRMLHTRNFLYMMGNLISKGVALMEAMRIVIEQTSNLCFHAVYMAIEQNLEKGRKLDQVLRPLEEQVIESGLYVTVPVGYLLESVSQAMTLGAKGGNLGEMLTEAYHTYEVQLQHRLSMGIKVIGFIISLFTYLVIIFMIGSLALTLLKIMEDPMAIA